MHWCFMVMRMKFPSGRIMFQLECIIVIQVLRLICVGFSV